MSEVCSNIISLIWFWLPFYWFLSVVAFLHTLTAPLFDVWQFDTKFISDSSFFSALPCSVGCRIVQISSMPVHHPSYEILKQKKGKYWISFTLGYTCIMYA
jgi:hypothetical protein